MKIVYACDLCGEIYDTEDQAKECEKKHLMPVGVKLPGTKCYLYKNPDGYYDINQFYPREVVVGFIGPESGQMYEVRYKLSKEGNA